MQQVCNQLDLCIRASAILVARKAKKHLKTPIHVTGNMSKTTAYKGVPIEQLVEMPMDDVIKPASIEGKEKPEEGPDTSAKDLA